MKIGFGMADITPRTGKVSLFGQFNERITDEVLDQLNAAVMIIESDSARTVWVSCDTCEIFEPVTQLAYKYAKELIPDLKQEEFTVSATHIHTGPCLFADTYLKLVEGREEPKEALSAAQCNEITAKGIQNAIKAALADLKDVRMDLAISRTQTGGSRRVTYKDGTAKMYGNAHDPLFYEMEDRDGGPMQLIYCYDKADKLTGIIANVPCTAQCDEHNTKMTADYWGVVRRILGEKLGKDVIIFPICRSAGDLSPHIIVDSYPVDKNSSARGPEACEWMGAIVADAILEAKDDISVRYGADACHKQGMKEIDFPVWQVTEDQYKWAKAYVADKSHYDETGFPKDKFTAANAATMVKRFESGDKIYKSRIYCTVIGDVAIISNPFELYIEYADRIRMAFPDKILFDTELTYDCLGYLATPAAVWGGHYSANIFNGVCAPDGGELLVEKSIELVKELVK